jgi:hypothetical protein
VSGGREGCVLVPAPADGCGHRPVRIGLETTLHDVNDSLPIVPAVGLCGGIALYMLAPRIAFADRRWFWAGPTGGGSAVARAAPRREGG